MARSHSLFTWHAVPSCDQAMADLSILRSMSVWAVSSFLGYSKHEHFCIFLAHICPFLLGTGESFGSYGMTVFGFSRFTAKQFSKVLLLADGYIHQRCISVLGCFRSLPTCSVLCFWGFFFVFLISAILVSVSWYHIVLICISLMNI